MNDLTNFEKSSNSVEEKLQKVRANIIKILQTRYIEVSEQVIRDINTINDSTILKKHINNSINVADFENFQQNLEKALLKK